MLCGAIDIGSNTTRLLVAEPSEGQLRKVMEQRAYTRIGKDASKDGKITAEKVAEVAEVVTTQVRLAHEMGAEVVKTVATAAIRESKNRDKVVKEIEEVAQVEVDVLDEEEEGRFAFIGATKSLGHPVEGNVAVGGSATSLRTLVGAVLEYETLERAVRVLSSDEIYEVAKRFELDSRRVKLLPAGVLLLEKFSQMLGQPLQIGRGGLREGIILTLLNGKENGSHQKLAA